MEPDSSLHHPQYPTIFPILSQTGQAHAPTSHFLKIHLNIIFPSTLGSSKWSISLRFPYQNPLYTSSFPPYVLRTCPVRLILLDLITRIILDREYRSLSSSLCSFLLSSSILNPYIFLSTLFANTLSLISLITVAKNCAFTPI